MSNLPVVSNALDQYMAQINQFQILSAQEEFALAVQYRDKDDIEAAHKLITSNLRFVVKIALEYKNYGVKLQDLIQEGNIGLMMAVKKFDPHKGYRFISYAVWWIRAYIQNFIIKTWSLVKIGTTQAQKKLFYKLGKVRRLLESPQEGHPQSYQDIAKDLGVKEHEIHEMEQRMGRRDVSLDLPFDENQELTPLELLSDDSPDQEDMLIQSQDSEIQREEISKALDKLSERERYIIMHRIMSDNPLTLREIGDTFQLSRERVRQIEKEALAKLRREMQNAMLS
ncbi:MAG: RNA polymerase sigma factor RpoH [Syntrophobacterales bacterium]|nr:MAG: RNA polymerase sigma factor RpoH [Syntrophobacterales bacterium]